MRFSRHPALAADTIVKRTIEGFVRPAYAAFRAASATTATEHGGALRRLRRRTRSAERAIGLRQPWSPPGRKVEIIRFGPITEDNRLERILYLAGPQEHRPEAGPGSTCRQGRIRHRSGDAARQKSVAMQGLGALEFVLFGTGSESLEATGRPLSLRLRAGGCAEPRRHGGGQSRCMARAGRHLPCNGPMPGADNPLYRTDDEAMTELFNVFVHGLEMIRDVRLNGFLGDDARRRQAEVRRSTGVPGDDRLASRQSARHAQDCSRPVGLGGKLPCQIPPGSPSRSISSSTRPG